MENTTKVSTSNYNYYQNTCSVFSAPVDKCVQYQTKDNTIKYTIEFIIV